MSAASPISEYRLTGHVRLQMERRGISETDIAQVLSAPEQTETIRVGRVVYQSRVNLGQPPRTYLLRVFVDIDRQPPQVVTAYRTGKAAKFWKGDI